MECSDFYSLNNSSEFIFKMLNEQLSVLQSLEGLSPKLEGLSPKKESSWKGWKLYYITKEDKIENLNKIKSNFETSLHSLLSFLSESKPKSDDLLKIESILIKFDKAVEKSYIPLSNLSDEFTSDEAALSISSFLYTVESTIKCANQSIENLKEQVTPSTKSSDTIPLSRHVFPKKLDESDKTITSTAYTNKTPTIVPLPPSSTSSVASAPLPPPLPTSIDLDKPKPIAATNATKRKPHSIAPSLLDQIKNGTKLNKIEVYKQPKKPVIETSLLENFNNNFKNKMASDSNESESETNSEWDIEEKNDFSHENANNIKSKENSAENENCSLFTSGSAISQSQQISPEAATPSASGRLNVMEDLLKNFNSMRPAIKGNDDISSEETDSDDGVNENR